MTSAKMFAITAGGWIVSYSTVEAFFKLVSLIVPTVLSVLAYIRANKKKKDQDREK